MSSQLTDIILNGAEKRLHNSMISIDLEKGTDYFYYKLLSDKIKCIRLSDETMKWFYSYLTSRVFFVSLDNVILEAGTVNCDFLKDLQEPLLFLLCINGIPQPLSNIIHTCMQMTLVFSINIITLRKLKMI